MPRGAGWCEMDDDRVKAERYRTRAEEIRTLAEDDKRPETYDILMKIAADYDSVAQSLEAIAES